MKGSIAIIDVRHAFHIHHICGEMSVYLQRDLVIDRTIYTILLTKFAMHKMASWYEPRCYHPRHLQHPCLGCCCSLETQCKPLLRQKDEIKLEMPIDFNNAVFSQTKLTSNSAHAGSGFSCCQPHTENGSCESSFCWQCCDHTYH